ncbi:MAG: molybdopterin-guanine dinucleotide biosynthesis protein B [Paracoccaceae bacterium]
MKIWGIVGWKNTGKTGLTTRLVEEFSARGLRVSTIKHAHHSADVDTPGTDSFRHRAAGACEVVLATPARIAFLQELRGRPEPDLAELLARMQPVDLVLIEGYKHATHPKIESHRAQAGTDLIARSDAHVRALASDTALDIDLPVLDLNDTASIADFIAAQLDL